MGTIPGDEVSWEEGLLQKPIGKTGKIITESGLNNSSAKFVPKNSIVIALAGQGKTRGKVARTRIDLTTNQSLGAITFDSNKIQLQISVFQCISIKDSNITTY